MLLLKATVGQGSNADFDKFWRTIGHKKCFFPDLMLSPVANPGVGLKVGWGSLATLYLSPSYSLFKANSPIPR